MTALFDLADTEMTDNLGSCIDDAARAQRVLNDAKADHALGFAIDHAKAVGGRDGLRWLRRSGQKIVLLCGPCHTRLHANNHTVYQDQHGHWQTRPATPDETPPLRPDSTRNTPRRQ